MPAYIVKKNLLISFFLLCCTLYGREIRVCLWRGRNPESVISDFRNRYNNGQVYVREDSGQPVIINKVDIEDYLAGVLAKEMDSLWPLEALKAQAVVSRTFAIYTAGVNKANGKPYDIENSIYHQVYGTTNCEKIGGAVRGTAGEVLCYEGRVVQIFFHADCGGNTARTSDVWGDSYPHISSVVDPYCEGAPYCRWEKTFTSGQIAGILGLSSIELPSIDKIEVEKTDGAGRVTLLKIFLKNGNIKNLTGHRFRMQVNNRAKKILFTSPDVLPSTAFTVSKTGNNFIFKGRGYGHGVGMCQWGARIMAQQGFDYRQILKHYFPEMEMEKR